MASRFYIPTGHHDCSHGSAYAGRDSVEYLGKDSGPRSALGFIYRGGVETIPVLRKSRGVVPDGVGRADRIHLWPKAFGYFGSFHGGFLRNASKVTCIALENISLAEQLT